jgi:hypothetical protein
VLDQLADRLDTRCAGELAQLGELLGLVHALREDRHGEAALGLGAG